MMNQERERKNLEERVLYFFSGLFFITGLIYFSWEYLTTIAPIIKLTLMILLLIITITTALLLEEKRRIK